MSDAFKYPPGTVGFSVPLYGGRVVICRRKADYKAAHKHLSGEDDDRDLTAVVGTVAQLTSNRGNTVYLVGLFDRHPGTLVHELVHVTYAILAHVNIPTTRENEEAFAYLMDALFAETTAALRKRKTR